jgi:1,2-diacylglycerol 3-alpha-glucosyltransferase
VFRIPAVPLPFDPEDRLMSIRDNGFRRRHGLPEDAFLLLYAGRVAYEKNIEFLMSMFRQVRKAIQRAMLLVAGEGPALAGLRERAKRMGLERHIRFVGHLDRNTELLECYQASEAFVFASPTETQGLVLLEAMASACRSRWASATRSSGASTCRYPRRP